MLPQKRPKTRMNVVEAAPSKSSSSELSPPAGPIIGRYRVETAGDERHILCVNAPNVRLRIEPGLAVTSSGLSRFGRQTIFLDGAYSGAPFHDNDHRHYSLDHHEGCVRSVTLATCEQAAVLLVLGLPIHEGQWTLVINEPDLDAILACWVLMNHVDLLRDNSRLLTDAMPLLRVEGNIDSYGFGKEVLTGLSPATLQQQREKLDMLIQPISELRASGHWTPPEYQNAVLRTLEAIDSQLLPEELLHELLEYEEIARVRLRGPRIAVLCRSSRGIYEVEEHLRTRYGKLLGIVVLEKGDGRFTIRRSDAFLSKSLTYLYESLNAVDRNVSQGEGIENRWGGADDIGGSPRRSGSALSGLVVLEEVGRLYGEVRSPWRRLTEFLARQRSASIKRSSG